MKQPIPILEYTADQEIAGQKCEPVILEMLVSKADPDYVARIANDLSVAGRTRVLYAESPLYWQKKLTKALVAGALFGVFVTSFVFLVTP